MSFQNLSLKRKLVGTIFLTSLFVLVLACLMLFYYEIQNYRQTTAQNLSTTADIIAANSASILIFDDQKLAQQILAELCSKPEIITAAFFDKNGKLYAAYPTNLSAAAFPTSIRSGKIRFQTGLITLYKPIIQGQSRVGTLFLQGDLNLKQHLMVYGLVLLMILFASGTVALFLSYLFQQQISKPLLVLAGVAKAISEQKDYSVRAPRTSNDELGDLTEAFNLMLNQIQKSHDETLAALRAKDDFLAALSHELRTPLNPVLLLASDAIKNPDLPPRVRTDFDTIRKSVELESRLIDDLLDLTRITRDKLSLEMKSLDVHDVLQEAIGTVRADAEKKQIELALDLRADKRIVSGDAVRLQQVFWNVLKNAVKFTPGGGTISVQTFAKDGVLSVKIIDTGIGMNAEELNRVFDAFSQEHAEGAPHRFGGLGLGLAISRKLVELHSGSIQAASGGKGAGSIFLIQLPLAQITKKDGTLPPAKSPGPILSPVSSAAAGTKRLRILLVDDHEPTRTTLMYLLARRRYKIATAASLSEARMIAGKQNFDVLISDIGLPDGSGYDLMAEFRERYGLKGIALTGYGMEQDVVRSQQAGFVAHLTKPVLMESLDGVLAVILDDKLNLIPLKTLKP